MQHRYTIGIDFGTLSARAVLVNLDTGEEVAMSVMAYQDAVLDRTLPNSNETLPMDFALQNPEDYEEALKCLLKEVWRKGKVNPDEVIGIGVDSTACTMIPLDGNVMPLCFDERYKGNLHSWPKLWKHHAAQQEADDITAAALACEMEFIKRYGYRISSEWMFPKILEVLRKAPEIYEATAIFMEAGDWTVYLLTNNICRSTCQAGYKAMWTEGRYPDREFLGRLDPRLHNVLQKLEGDVLVPGVRAGGLTREMAQITGLSEGISVSVSIIDAHASIPAVGICEPGKMLMIMGTSICHLVMSDTPRMFPGISGVVKDGVIRDLYCYEAGQVAVGDIYEWFIYSGIMPYYAQEMHERNVNVFRVIDEKWRGSGRAAADCWRWTGGTATGPCFRMQGCPA